MRTGCLVAEARTRPSLQAADGRRGARAADAADVGAHQRGDGGIADALDSAARPAGKLQVGLREDLGGVDATAAAGAGGRE